MINTDIHNYLEERISDGFPSMSSRMRKMTEPLRTNDNIDSYYQVHPTEQTGMDYLGERKEILCNGRVGKFHRSLLEDVNMMKLADYLLDVTGIQVAERWDKKETLWAILNQMECDVAMCTLRPDGTHYISMVHLVMANGWSAEDAIGRDFSYMHKDVQYPDGKHVLPMNDKFIHGLINAGNVFERVGAYSLRDKLQPQRHTEDMVASDYDNLKNLFLRFERQTIMNLPELQSFIFFIHSHFVDCKSNPDFFINAIEKSAPNCYVWKDVRDHGEKMIRFLKNT